MSIKEHECRSRSKPRLSIRNTANTAARPELFVKTSTGFGPGGATAAAVARMRRAVGPGIGVKASGGIAGAAIARTMLAAGADRLGASASLAILDGWDALQ